MRHRSIVAVLILVASLWLGGCTDPSAGGTAAPGATSPASPAPSTDVEYTY